jgi:hypothetical protein
MTHFKYIVVACFLIVGAGPATAKDDPMVTQRCIWRCMADTPEWSGKNAKIYSQCVSKNCDDRKSSKRRR